MEKRFEAFYCARSSPANHKPASALALFYLPLGSCPSLTPQISRAADRLQFGEQPNSIARQGQPASSLASRPGGLEFLFLGGRGLHSRTHASKLGDRPAGVEKAGSREPRRGRSDPHHHPARGRALRRSARGPGPRRGRNSVSLCPQSPSPGGKVLPGAVNVVVGFAPFTP